MNQEKPNFFSSPNFNPVEKKEKIWINIVLLILTFITTTIAGAEWIRGFGTQFEFSELAIGLPYSISILFVLSCHEFGHYFAARYHKVKATLPYFIPFPSLLGFLNFGTLGAVIKTKSPINNRRALLDIGAAGPIAGFIASVAILIYGFTHLPGKEYILAIHPDFDSPAYGEGALQLEFGYTLLYFIFEKIFAQGAEFIPPMSEIYHYPFLCVGWFGLFITSMNMIPVGQLDGGHITYAMFGEKKQYSIASIAMLILIVIGVIGFLSMLLEFTFYFGWSGWLFWAVILYFIIKVKHPPVYDETEIDSRRRFVGYLCYAIFILSFSPAPFVLTVG